VVAALTHEPQAVEQEAFIHFQIQRLQKQRSVLEHLQADYVDFASVDAELQKRLR
jgi:hypothetical protein